MNAFKTGARSMVNAIKPVRSQVQDFVLSFGSDHETQVTVDVRTEAGSIDKLVFTPRPTIALRR